MGRFPRVDRLIVLTCALLGGLGPGALGTALARLVLVPNPAHADLQAALAQSTPGDTLLVAPGRYLGPVSIGDRVVVIATAGPDSTLLDGGGKGPVVEFMGVGPETLLEGFTITGGVLLGDQESGAGIRLARGASPRLNWNRITGNQARGRHGHGGGIACLDGANPLIANSRIESNVAEDGGGIYIGKGGGWSSSPSLFGNVIVHNVARGRGGGVAVGTSSEPVLVENVIAWNEARQGGAGLAIEQAQPQLRENVVWANADSAGLASGILLTGYASPHIERNVIAKNRGGPGLSCEPQFQEWQDFRCNVVWGNEPVDFSAGCAIYPGNLSLDPAFCDPDREAFELKPGSPCLQAAGCGGRIGARGLGCKAEYGAAPRPGAPAGDP